MPTSHPADLLLPETVLAHDARILSAPDLATLWQCLARCARDLGNTGAWTADDVCGKLSVASESGAGIAGYAQRIGLPPEVILAATDGPITDARGSGEIRVIDARALACNARADTVDSSQVAAIVPICDVERCIGVLVLYGDEPVGERKEKWLAALAHVKVIADAALKILNVEREHAHLRSLALTDALTGLPNRAALNAWLAEAIPRAHRSGKPLVVGLLDIDRFKPVNDLFGHDAGDRVLKEIARRLQTLLRSGDFVARLSGDEFVFVLEDMTAARAGVDRFLARLATQLAAPLSLAEVNWRCDVSIGLTICPSATAATAHDALGEADNAMRVSKRKGGTDFTWWSPELMAAQEPDNGGRAADESQLYGAALAAVMEPLTEALQRNVARIVNEFYEKLFSLPKSAAVLRNFSKEELEHLKAQQIQNLLMLASSTLTAQDHRTTALRVGRIHAIIGLDHEELVLSGGVLSVALHNHIGASVPARALSVFRRRMNRDLAHQTDAYQRVQGARQKVLLAVTKLAWQEQTYADLIIGAVNMLGAYEEFAACSISRPDRDGIFRPEAAAGNGIERYFAEMERVGSRIAAAADRPQGQGVTGRAWRGGAVERVINFQTDAQAEPWRALARAARFRSSVAIPLVPPGRAPLAVLSIYSAFPGGFSSSDQSAFIDALQTVISFAMGKLEDIQGRTGTVPYAQRRRWVALLHSDALQMHYQPMLDLKTGRVTKLEALARLKDGDRLLTPDVFLPTFTSGDLYDLYSRGLEQVLSEQGRLAQHGIEVNVALNLPSAALVDERYFDVTRDTLGAYGCDANRLTLEILETEELPRGVDLYGALAKFKALGVELAEDDLGSGHNGLSRLRTLQFDAIKIDRGLIAAEGNGSDPSDPLRFIYQLTRLGHSLGKRVIVEGVEDPDLLEAVALLGADTVQGYAVARPMPSASLFQWFAQRAGQPEPVTVTYGLLARLARLLLWVERIELAAGDPDALRRLAQLIALSQQSAQAMQAASPLIGTCLECPLTRLFVDGDAVATQRPSLAPEVLDTLVNDLPTSAAFRAARNRFIAQIGQAAASAASA